MPNDGLAPRQAESGEYWIGYAEDLDAIFGAMENADPGALLEVLKAIRRLRHEPKPEGVTEHKSPHINTFLWRLKIESVKHDVWYTVDERKRQIYVSRVGPYIV